MLFVIDYYYYRLTPPQDEHPPLGLGLAFIVEQV